MNGDGKPDLAVTNAGSASISIYRNKSSLSTIIFDNKLDLPTGSIPVSLTFGDIDGDGKPDLAVASQADSVYVLRNNTTAGTIAFDEYAMFGVTGSPNSIALGDLDGDSKPDVVVSNTDSSTVSIFRNIVDGPNITSFTPSGAPRGVTVRITGTNFTGVTGVFFGKIKAMSFSVLNATTIAAVVDSGASGAILVITQKGSAIRNGFVFLPPPSITSFTPTEGEEGTIVTIAGYNLGQAQTVSFGDTMAASFAIGSTTSITAIVGKGTSGKISVTTPYGTGSLDGFTFFTSRPVPAITSFTPASGPIGTTVTITGINFSTTSSDNIIYFGAVRANVISCTANSLTTKVPPGATYQPITVTVNHRIACSARPFAVLFPGAFTAFSDHSVTAAGVFGTGLLAYTVTLSDFDGDGKPDLAAANSASSSVTVNRNTSKTGKISYSPKQSFGTGSAPYVIVTGDMNGDGKTDVVSVNDGSTTVSILINTSTSGIISFAPKFELPAISHPQGVAVGDIDGDGRLDIAVVNTAQATLSVYRNTSVNNAISFASKVDYATGDTPISVCIADLNGDGKAEITVTNQNVNSVSIYKNISAVGSISLAAKTDMATGTLPKFSAIGDLDGDGKPDIVTCNSNLYDNTISVFKNTSTSDAISFAPMIRYGKGSSPVQVTIDDLDGDGKPEILFINANNYKVSILKNTSRVGALSFSAEADYYMGGFTVSFCTGDMDGDGKPDIAAVSYSSENTPSSPLLRNTVGEAMVIIPTSSGNVGNVVSKLTIDADVHTYNGIPYVQRHYDIEPEVNASITNATVTLYFNQQDFDNFNAYPGHGPDLPTGPADDIGKAALRVSQFHGISATALPGSYTGKGVEINPDDNNILWDTVAQCWQVTFNVTGFSGFFINSAGSALLPLKLLSFTAKEEDNLAIIQWRTTDEAGVSYFDLQRSTDGKSFSTIHQLNAINNTAVNQTYQYKDTLGDAPVYYYRLKIADRDQSFNFSQIVNVKPHALDGLLKINPNPARHYVWVTYPASFNKSLLRIIDFKGQVVLEKRVELNTLQTKVDVTELSSGIYKLIWNNGKATLIKSLLIE